MEIIRKQLLPCCDILSYCLMPNLFHLFVHANELSVVNAKDKSFPRQQFSQGIKHLLGSYARAINKQTKGSGSLFKQNTKALCIDRNGQAEAVFHYMHQCPMKAGIVARMEDWSYSSFREYLVGTGLCNQVLAKQILGVDFSDFYNESYLTKAGPYSFKW